MMKKSLIALAVAAASTSAFAVDVSGGLTVYAVDSGTAATNWTPAYNGGLSFKGKEDLGGGMSAFYEVSLDLDKISGANDTSVTAAAVTATSSAASVTTSSTNLGQMKDMKIGISSSMGTLVLGRMEYLVEGVVSAQFDDLLTDADGHNSAAESAESTLTYFGRADAIAYVSPEWNGFHFAVAGNMDAATSGLTQHTDILGVYKNGPLTVMAGKTDLDAASGDITSFTASYTFAGVKGTVGSFTKDNGASADQTDTLIRLDYSMGPVDLMVINKNSDVAGDDTTSYKATYNMSKRTSAYVGLRAREGANKDQTMVGLTHKF